MRPGNPRANGSASRRVAAAAVAARGASRLNVEKEITRLQRASDDKQRSGRAVALAAALRCAVCARCRGDAGGRPGLLGQPSTPDDGEAGGWREAKRTGDRRT